MWDAIAGMDPILGVVLALITLGGIIWRWGGRAWDWIRAKICPADPEKVILLERRLAREQEMTDICVIWRRLEEPIVSQLPNGATQRQHRVEVATRRCLIRKPDVGDAPAIVSLPIDATVEPGWEIDVRGMLRLVYSVTAPGPHDVEILAAVQHNPSEWNTTRRIY